jgi:hypothetical protein
MAPVLASSSGERASYGERSIRRKRELVVRLG